MDDLKKEALRRLLSLDPNMEGISSEEADRRRSLVDDASNSAPMAGAMSLGKPAAGAFSKLRSMLGGNSGSVVREGEGAIGKALGGMVDDLRSPKGLDQSVIREGEKLRNIREADAIGKKLGLDRKSSPMSDEARQQLLKKINRDPRAVTETSEEVTQELLGKDADLMNQFADFLKKSQKGK